MGTNSKDKRDVYYRMAKKEGYRARSAYKLIHIDQEYRILDNISNVVDLCCAPGSWSQVLANRMQGNGKIISVDMQKILPIENVNFIQEDITTDTCKQKILELSQEKIDLIVFDGAPDVTGIIDLDEFHQTVLLKEALTITTKIAKTGANFVGKCFRSEDTGFIISHFKKFFDVVKLVKPKSSRTSSHECFILGIGYKESIHDPQMLDVDCMPENNVLIVCGQGPDSDLSQCLDELSISSSFKPIEAPYEEAIKIRQIESSKKQK